MSQKRNTGDHLKETELSYKTIREILIHGQRKSTTFKFRFYQNVNDRLMQHRQVINTKRTDKVQSLTEKMSQK